MEKTAHQIWKVLEKKSFTAIPEKRKLERKKKNSLKYNKEENINIFIAKL